MFWQCFGDVGNLLILRFFEFNDLCDSSVLSKVVLMIQCIEFNDLIILVYSI